MLGRDSMVKSKPSATGASAFRRVGNARISELEARIADLDERIARIDSRIERFAVGSMRDAFSEEMREYYSVGDGDKELGPGVFSGGLDRAGFDRQAMAHMNTVVLGGLRGRLVTERMRLRRQLRELG